MTEQLISFQTAKLAKEKGFNESCDWVYDNNENRRLIEQLPEFQQKKDALFCAIVDALK